MQTWMWLPDSCRHGCRCGCGGCCCRRGCGCPIVAGMGADVGVASATVAGADADSGVASLTAVGVVADVGVAGSTVAGVVAGAGVASLTVADVVADVGVAGPNVAGMGANTDAAQPLCHRGAGARLWAGACAPRQEGRRVLRGTAAYSQGQHSFLAGPTQLIRGASTACWWGQHSLFAGPHSFFAGPHSFFAGPTQLIRRPTQLLQLLARKPAARVSQQGAGAGGRAQEGHWQAQESCQPAG